MVYERLHQDIAHLRWEECVSTLGTDAGKAMAKEVFKNDFPLHMACERRAPEQIIIDLINANPDAAMSPGKKGNLPLHLASQHGLSLETIVMLIKAFPEGLDELNDNQSTPRDFHQRNSKVREVMNRPTACWVELVEREEYYHRKQEMISELRDKVASLKAALEQAKRTRHDITIAVRSIEPLVSEEARILARTEKQEKNLEKISGGTSTAMDVLKERMACIENECQKTVPKDEVTMRSREKREHVENVTQEYDKAVGSLGEIRQELVRLKVKVRLDKAKREVALRQ